MEDPLNQGMKRLLLGTLTIHEETVIWNFKPLHIQKKSRGAFHSQHHNPAIDAADAVPAAGIAVAWVPTCHSAVWILLHP